jgi:hypothetical protein
VIAPEVFKAAPVLRQVEGAVPVHMAIELDFFPVGSGNNSCDAIVVRHGEGQNAQIVVIDGGYEETGQSVCAHIRYFYGVKEFLERDDRQPREYGDSAAAYAHAFSSRFSSLKKRQSAACAIILLGIDLIIPASAQT